MKIRHKLLLALGIAVLLVILGVALYSLRITSIVYIGSTHYTKEELNEKIFDKKYSLNPFYCFWESKYGEKKVIPFIQGYDIEFKGWNEITVRVYEKSVVGYVTYMVLYQKLPVEKEDIFNYILDLTQTLIKYELPADKIEFDEGGNAVVCIGSIRFRVGTDSYLNEKIARISDLLPETAGLAGTFFMEDVTEDTDTFRFEKSE